eukprot:5166364-Heterocapsa_arctica.AAC.1
MSMSGIIYIYDGLAVGWIVIRTKLARGLCMLVTCLTGALLGWDSEGDLLPGICLAGTLLGC